MRACGRPRRACLLSRCARSSPKRGPPAAQHHTGQLQFGGALECTGVGARYARGRGDDGAYACVRCVCMSAWLGGRTAPAVLGRSSKSASDCCSEVWEEAGEAPPSARWLVSEPTAARCNADEAEEGATGMLSSARPSDLNVCNRMYLGSAGRTSTCTWRMHMVHAHARAHTCNARAMRSRSPSRRHESRYSSGCPLRLYPIVSSNPSGWRGTNLTETLP